ncbi:MAG: hypothetical protein JXR76_08390 [Deltaproteobacteria bacterium]|nr:hypothetical protein [Deltaproteobacteria bacterium]
MASVFLEADKFITSMDNDGKISIKFRFANQRHPDDEEKYVEKELPSSNKAEKEISQKYVEFLQKQCAAGAKIWVELSDQVEKIECESKSTSNGMG